MYKIYDCSNSDARPAHDSKNGGPVENDIMRGLKKFAFLFGFKFVSRPSDADVIITNDVFPYDILAYRKPLVKRMDGIYWQPELRDRNKSLNGSALMADMVIFISEFSRNSLKELYPEVFNRLRNHSVVLNCVNTDDFKPYPGLKPTDEFIWVATATNWERPEKRFDAILDFVKDFGNDEKLILIGNYDRNSQLSKKVIPVGYLSDENIGNILGPSHAFVNFSYRDAGSKVTCQALMCGLPVLYSISGGVPEIVRTYGKGIGIKDMKPVPTFIPKLKMEDIHYAHKSFRWIYNELSYSKQMGVNRFDYRKTMQDYFSEIAKVL
jgi:glycosyltransferase involved in cell wall biosynthesis